MGLASDTQRILQLLEKAVGTGDVTSLIKEDLEPEAYNSLYRESDQNEFRLLKTLARKPAVSIAHEFVLITEFSGNSSTGFFGQSSLPKEAKIVSERKILDIKLLGEIASVFALANFQTPVRALDKNNLVDINEMAARLSLLRKINQAAYKADTADTASTLRFKGIKQQIREGTVNSPVSHVVNLKGKRLTPANIRLKAREIAELYGRITCLYMPPLVAEQLENELLTDVERLLLPRAPGEKVILGSSVGGMNTGGGVVTFELDNDLTPQHMYGKPPASPNAIVPTPDIVAISNVAPAATPGSLWDVPDSGDVYYYISYLGTDEEEETEGPKLRYPAGVGAITVLAGQAVSIRINPVPANIKSIKFYRGYKTANPNALTNEAMFVKEVSRSGVEVTFVDLNEHIPGSAEVYGLTVNSQNYQAIKNAGAHYQTALPNLDIENQPGPGNTISFVNLGPFMGVFDLARIWFTANRDLLFAACAPEVAVPTKNVVWTNVGTRI